jgi:two-component system chemotaxis sensor kinase CheA
VPLDLARYLTLFVAEAGEHLAGLSRGLVELEQAVAADEDSAPLIDGIFRHVHSIKGMSASMQLDGIAALAHQAEDLVDLYRRRLAKAEPVAVDALLDTCDALGDMVEAASRKEKPDPDPVLVARLGELTRLTREGRPLPRPPPHVADPPAEPAAPELPTRRTPVAIPIGPRTPVSIQLGAPGEPAAVVAGPRRLEVEVEVAAACPVPAVRAFLVIKKLAGLGAVLRATPTVEELKAGRLPGKKLTVVLESAEPLERIERALALISDLGAVAIRAPGDTPAALLPAPPAPPRDPASVESSRTVRVRTEVLDSFVDTVGELLLATARIREVGRTLPAPLRPPLDEGVDRLHAIVKELHGQLMGVRMTPLSVVTERLPRTARDVARKLGRQVEVEIHGAEIELDRAILEELSDPLLHLLRNAVDHGIEAPHLRLLAGKPATGHITITARRDRDRVVIELADDGKGMNAGRLREAAVRRGSLTPEQAAALSEREALQLATLPGVSTADTVTDVSGRGVGLDAVKKTLETVGGTLELESARGLGTRITLRLPLTVAVQPVLLVQVGEEVVGLPIAKVHGAVIVGYAGLDRSRGGPLLPYDGELVPVHDLAVLLGFDSSGRDERAVVVADGADGRIGLAVDSLLGQHEAVLKPLGPPLQGLGGLSAVTVLGTGRPVFILDVTRLLAA